MKKESMIDLQQKEEQRKVKPVNGVLETFTWLSCNKERKNIFCKKELLFFLILFLASSVRNILWSTYFNWNPLSIFADLFYLFIFYFNVVGVFVFLNKSKISKENLKSFFYSHSLYLGVLFILIPIITYITGSNTKFTIPIFKLIPTLNDTHNYMPSGMLYVIPLIIYFFMINVKKHTNINLIRAFVHLIIALGLIYLVFYQWIFQFNHIINNFYGYRVAISIYGIMMLLYSLPIFIFSKNKIGLHRNWTIGFWLSFYTFLFFGVSDYIYKHFIL